MGDISTNFSRSEFACPCGCGKNKIDEEFVKNGLQPLRDKIGGIEIASGYRCQAHNERIGGSPTSMHLKGIAADIIPLDVPMWVAVIAVVYSGFFGFGFGENNIHVDARPDNSAWWVYRSKKP